MLVAISHKFWLKFAILPKFQDSTIIQKLIKNQSYLLEYILIFLAFYIIDYLYCLSENLREKSLQDIERSNLYHEINKIEHETTHDKLTQISRKIPPQ